MDFDHNLPNFPTQTYCPVATSLGTPPSKELPRPKVSVKTPHRNSNTPQQRNAYAYIYCANYEASCVVIYKMKLSGVAPRKRETTNMGSAKLSGAFFALSNDGSQAMVGVGKPLSHDHLRTEVLFGSKFHYGVRRR